MKSKLPRRLFVAVAVISLVVGVGIPDASAAGTAGTDGFRAARMLPAGNSTNTGHTAFATIQANEPDHAGDPPGATVWWKYRRTNTRNVRLSLNGSNFDTILAVYRGPNLANLTEVASNDDASVPSSPLWSRLEFTAQANVTYRIVVGGYGASAPIDGDERRGAYKLTVTVLPPAV